MRKIIIFFEDNTTLKELNEIIFGNKTKKENFTIPPLRFLLIPLD